MTRPLRRRARPVAVAVALLLSVVLGACSSGPDVTPSPDPPRPMVAMQRPFDGATLPTDRDTAAARWQSSRGAPWLSAITRVPQARWVNGTADVASLPPFVDTARRQGALPVVVAYDIPDRSCDGFRAGAPYDDFALPDPRPDSYAAFIRGVIGALGSTRSVIVLEPDAVAADCYTPARAAVLKQATRELQRAGHHVYLDGGHDGWRSSGEMAMRLLDSGIADAEGFALNVSNRSPVSEATAYGEEISELVGGRDYVVDTGRNGAGTRTPDNPRGVEEGDWCNPPAQALGPRPSTTVRSPAAPHFAAALWIKPPGESDGDFGPEIGDCHGETVPPGEFSAEQARTLIENDPTTPSSIRRQLGSTEPTG